MLTDQWEINSIRFRVSTKDQICRDDERFSKGVLWKWNRTPFPGFVANYGYNGVVIIDNRPEGIT